MIAYTSFKRYSLLAFILLFTLSALPLAASATDVSSAVQIKLVAGDPNVTINGVQTKVQTPYVQAGTTMVPLSVITKAFGAGLKLENNKIITLTYNKTSVVLTLGSKTIIVNGQASTLAAEPKAVNGVTMVPLRVIAQSFGASLAQAAGSKQIIITGVKAGAVAAAPSSAIDSDSGKSKVGDSYFDWTLDYPTGLALLEQSDNGDFIAWGDTGGNAYVAVTARKLENELTTAEIRDEMASGLEEGEITVERRTVTVNGAAFEKLVTQTRDKRYYEIRTTQQNGNLYYVIVGIKAENKSGLSKYQALLDSFQTSFDTRDTTVKNVTKVKNGMMVAQDRDFGLSVQLPADWQREQEAPFPIFTSDKAFMSFQISSLTAGETFEGWTSRNREIWLEDFTAEYTKSSEESKRTIEGVEAVILKNVYSYDKKLYHAYYDVLLVKGDYKYHVRYRYEDENDLNSARLFDTILATIDIDTDYVEENFAIIEENEDRSSKAKKTSRTYGYSLQVPAHWVGEKTDFESDEIAYGSLGVSFFLSVYKNETKWNLSSNIRGYFQQSAESAKFGYRIMRDTEVTIGGVQATRLEVDVTKPEDGIPYQWTVYLFEKNGYAYTIDAIVNKANATPHALQLFDDIIASFSFAS
jgi:hypothetical protein